MHRAIDYFNHAIARDPNYALAYAGLADCYDLLCEYSAVSPKESYPKAKAAAIKALELDNLLGQAHTSLAYSLINYDWDWRNAEREYRRAIQLDPNSATAHQWCYAQKGMYDEAIAEMQKAVEFSGNSTQMIAALGYAYAAAGRRDAAQNIIAELERRS